MVAPTKSPSHFPSLSSVPGDGTDLSHSSPTLLRLLLNGGAVTVLTLFPSSQSLTWDATTHHDSALRDTTPDPSTPPQIPVYLCPHPSSHLPDPTSFYPHPHDGTRTDFRVYTPTPSLRLVLFFLPRGDVRRRGGQGSGVGSDHRPGKVVRVKAHKIRGGESRGRGVCPSTSAVDCSPRRSSEVSTTVVVDRDLRTSRAGSFD